ncbi:Cyclic nucleotide-binding-like protein [Gracilaria domingensis]|nr:Cyclic nucleotide-binding-like protein [Gracilaria domingensis]
MLVLAHGYARRLRLGDDGVERQLKTPHAPTISELHVTAGDPLFASAKCVTRSCTAYAMSRADFRAHLQRSPALSTQVIESLSDDVLSKTRQFRTPLLSQRANEINLSAVAVASVVESYYRSALNALLNRRLSGISAPLFPNMHVQVPARVLYITGFKSLRAILDRDIDPDRWNTHPARVAVRFGKTIAPGVIMTPISSILEASNAGHVNSEPLLRRSLHGSVPRLGREVVFGVGLNQLSDYMEERYRPLAPNALAANMAGSLTAGVVSGYLSHVPHNLSTYKLLKPQQSYSELFTLFVDKSVPEHLIPAALPQSVVPAARVALACLFPRGVLIRTVQICGSFAILNGIILVIETDSRNRITKAMDSIQERTEAEEGVKVARSQSE